MESFGFIILRHVNSETTAKYWKLSYECVRKYYPENEIMIIDDNSNYKFIKEEDEKNLYKVRIIKSEYPGRGELLPYIYYLRNKLFDSACIIHDSVFFNKYVDLTIDNYKNLWDINHDYDNSYQEVFIIRHLTNHKKLYFFYKKKTWKGCFGGMTIIKYNYLKYLNDLYDFSKLINLIINRNSRMCFERILGCILQFHNIYQPSLFGYINIYLKKYTKEKSISFENYNNLKNMPIIKVFTGR